MSCRKYNGVTTGSSIYRYKRQENVFTRCVSADSIRNVAAEYLLKGGIQHDQM